MPIFDVDGQEYDVREEHIYDFVSRYPDAYTVINRKGQDYRVKAADYSAFMAPSGTRTSPKRSFAPMENFVDPNFGYDPELEAENEEKRMEARRNAFWREIMSEQSATPANSEEPSYQPAPIPAPEPRVPMNNVPAHDLMGAMSDIDDSVSRWADTERLQAEAEELKEQEEWEKYLRQVNRLQVDSLKSEVLRGIEENSSLADLVPGPMGATMAITNADDRRRKDLSAFSAANTSLDNAQQIIEEADIRGADGIVDEGKDTFLRGATRGLGTKLFDVRTWDMGLTDLNDAGILMEALDVADAGGELTEAQRALLDAKAVELATNAYFGSYLGRGYKAGSVTAESLPFMLEMAINPLSAVGRGSTAKLTRYAMKRFGKEALRKHGKTYLVGKAGARVLSDAAGAAGMTVTTGLGQTAADAMQRMTGEIKYGTSLDGSASYSHRLKGDDAFTAVTDAILAGTIERQSEMFGNYINPILKYSGASSVLSKITNQKVLDFIDDFSHSRVVERIAEFEKATQWNGVFGEFLEEVYGGLMNSIVVGDQTFDTDEDTGVLNPDNLIDTFLGVALFGGFVSTVKTAAYPIDKYSSNRDLKRADVEGIKAFGGSDVWGSVKERISSANVLERGASVREVLADTSLTPQQKKVVLDYVGKLQRVDGVRIGSLKYQADFATPVEVREVEQSYDNGYTLQTPQEKNDAKTMLEERAAAVRRLYALPEDADVDEFLGDNPLESILESEKLGASREETKVKLDYLNAKATYDGMLQAVRDDIDGRIAESDALVDSRISETDGRIHPARLKQDDRSVYIVAGNVALLEDGSVDTANSDKFLIAKDANTGELFSTDPSALLDAGAVVEAEVEKETLRQQIRESVAQQAEDEISGRLAFALGDTYPILDSEGVQHSVQILADNGDGTVQVSIDGETKATAMPKEQVQMMFDAVNRARAAEYAENERLDQENAEAEQAIEEVAEQEVEQPILPAEEAVEEQPQAPVIPTLKDGSPDYNAMDADMFTEQSVANFGEEVTEKVARNNIADADKVIASTKKQLDSVTDPNKIQGLYTKLKDAESRRQKYVDVLDRLGLSEDANETADNRRDRLKQEATSRMGILFPEGLPNAEAVILADIANGQKIRWSDKVVNGAVVSKGLGAELGLSGVEAERRRRIGIIGKDAPTPEEYAEQLRERLDMLGIAYEETELRDKVIEAYSVADTRRAAWAELERMASRNNEDAMNYEDVQMERAFRAGQQRTQQEHLQEQEYEPFEAETPTPEELEQIAQEFEQPTPVAEEVVEQPVAEETQPTVEEVAEAEAGAVVEPTEAQAPVAEAPKVKRISKKEDARRQPLRERVQAWADHLGIKVNVMEDVADVKNKAARNAIEGGQNVSGWYEPSTGEVSVYMPNARDVSDIDKTIIHEIVAHKGLRYMLGEKKFNKLLDRVWNMMSKKEKAKYIAYPGVNGDTRAAADEYIAHLAEGVNLNKAEKTTWEKIVAFVREFLADFGIDIQLPLSDGDIADLIRASYNTMVRENLQAKQESGSPVDIDEEGGQALFSIRTYEESGRSVLRSFLKERVADKAITKEEADDIEATIEKMYETAIELKGKYAPFGAWSDATVVETSDGAPAFSVVKNNGEYEMNLDFSTSCKKRRTQDAVLDELLMRGHLERMELDAPQLVQINDIIRSYGFETACAVCFVDAKRFRLGQIADKFCAFWNPLTEMTEAQLKSVIDGEKKKSVLKKAATHLIEHPEDRITVNRSSFLSVSAFEDMMLNHPAILSFYKQAQGSSIAKIPVRDVQYLNDIIRKGWDVEEAYDVGGVRIQSFSDYIPRLFFDYMQMIAELSAKELPAHAYTKEPLFAKQFGLTGMKVNLSLVPDVADGGVAAGLDAEGNYVWKQGQTFPYDEAIAIQNAEGYRENCGTIAIGVSDAHIEKMLDDPNIRMVIPYHKSGINPIVAKMNRIDAFTDYTNVQNTRDAKGVKIVGKGLKGMPNFNALMHEGMDARQAAQTYLDWCDSMGYIPKFDKWRDHPNYYKLLEDFTSIVPNAEGVETIFPQRKVTMTFPSDGSAFGSIKSLIREGLEEDAILEGRRREKVGEIVDAIEKVMLPSTKEGTQFRVTSEMDAEYLEAVESGDIVKAQRMVDEAAEMAGYTIRGSHGTTHSFTVFDKVNANIENSFGRGHYFTTSVEDAEINYASVEGPDLKHRIEMLAERMEQYEDNEGKSYEELKEQATKILSGDENRVISAALRMENPVVFSYDPDGNFEETFFDLTEEYNEETDEYGEPEGLLVDFLNAIEEELNEGEYFLPSGLNLWEGAFDYDGYKADELKAYIDSKLADVYDEDGYYVSSELFRAALERMGFDGIIDNAPANRFRNMGLGRSVKHFIVFSPNQIKQADPVTYDDAGNVIPLSKRFNPRVDDIRFRFIGEQGAANLDKAEEATIRLDNLAVARQMEESGKDAKTIKMATGWERGADGKWRYETGDSKMLAPDKWVNKRGALKLESILEDDNGLFDAYPILKSIKIKKSNARSTGGSYSEKDNTITIDVGILKSALSVAEDPKSYRITEEEARSLYQKILKEVEGTLLHEIQHAIQHEEGFATGGNSRMVLNDARDAIADLWEKWRARATAYNQKPTYWRSTPAGIAERAAIMSEKRKIRNLQKRNSIGDRGYEQLAGEVEARNVEKRMNYSMEQRLASLASETEDVAREDQIFIYDALADKTQKAQFRIGDNEHTQAMNAKQKQPSQTEVVDESDILFRISKNNRTTIGSWLNKRGDLTDAEREAFLTYLDESDYDGKTQLATGRWFANGAIRIPEDMPKVEQAIKVATIAKVDPLRYNSPMELIDRHADIRVKGKPIDPDTVSTLSDRREIPGTGIVTYLVEESEESRENMRKIINTHFGEDASPWCLLQGDGMGSLTPQSRMYWDRYSAYPKRVAFKDGKLIAFSASDQKSVQWWDRQDRARSGIPVVGAIPNDELGRVGTLIYSDEGKPMEIRDIHKGNKTNGTYEVWHDNGQLAMRRHYVNGVVDGLQETWYPDGQKLDRGEYRLGKPNGIHESWFKNGQKQRRITYVDGEKNGLYETWYPDGQREIKVNINAGGLDGLCERWTPSGEIAERSFYKNGKLEGTKLLWYTDGSMQERSQWLNGKRNGITEIWYDGEKRTTYYLVGRICSKEEYETVMRALGEDVDGTSFRVAPAFVSNAAIALDGIKQEKATPQQWLAMLKKAGGIKAGEDKWIGLSDWLEQSDAKTLTKQEVADFIRQNQIQIEEVEYSDVENNPRFIELQEEYKQLLEENDNNDERAFEEMVERYGEDFELAFSGYGNELHADTRFGDDAVAYFLEHHTINETRRNYTTDGLDNKREIALTVPTIKSWNEGDLVHFGDAGEGRAIAWIRFGETTDSDGKRVLVIDEIQSKRHQEGREKGYITDDIIEAQRQRDYLYKKMYREGLTEEELNRYHGLGSFIEENFGIVPEAPFEKNWHELAMKRILRYAAEHGFDKVAWTKGDQQAERYSIGGVISKIGKNESNNIDEQNFEIGLAGAESMLYLTTDNDGKIIHSLASEYVGRTLSEVFGKELAVKMLNAKENTAIEGDGLRIGGEGMRAFYDKMLPSFMNKYGKKWGATVQDVTLPNVEEAGRTMHSVDVTDAMRQSVIEEGQTMFRFIGTSGAGNLDQAEESTIRLDNLSVARQMEEAQKDAKTIKMATGWERGADGKWRYETLDDLNEEAIADITEGEYVLEDFVGESLFVAYPPLRDVKVKVEPNVGQDYGGYWDRVNKLVVIVEGNDYRSVLVHEIQHAIQNEEGFTRGINPRSEMPLTDDQIAARNVLRSAISYVTHFGDVNIAAMIHDDKKYGGFIWDSLPQGTKDILTQLAYARKKLSRDEAYSRLNRLWEIATRKREVGKNRYSRQAGEVEARNVEKRMNYSMEQRRSSLASETEDVAREDQLFIYDGVGTRHAVAESLKAIEQELGATIKVIESIEDITDPNPRAQERKRKQKSWYDPQADEVVVVLPNVENGSDARKSAFMDVVGRKGLRELLGDKAYKEFLRKVYQGGSAKVREAIARSAGQHGWNLDAATETYVAGLAERGFDGREDRTFFEQVKDFFSDALSQAKIALGVDINDNDLRYILWRTYQMQRSKGAMAVAEDVAMQAKLGVGNYAPSSTQFRVVYHGAGTDFDKFDHSYMGTGQGDQIYGWGTYVTEVKGIGEKYAIDAMKERGATQIAYKIRQLEAEKRRVKENIDFFKKRKEASNGEEEKYDNIIKGLEKRIDGYQKEIDRLSELQLPTQRTLYSVDIPDNNGENYIVWEEAVPKDIRDRVFKELDDFNSARVDDIRESMEFPDSETDENVLKFLHPYISMISGRDMYFDLSRYLGGDKEASIFLSRAGIVGISYPAEGTTGGRADKARNYVIFNEKDLKIEDKTQFRVAGTPYGNNSGYEGRSMSKRAVEARKEGRFPKTDFKRVYNIPESVLQALVDARIISNTEWHHTSPFGNRTPFYGWENLGAADFYKAHKEEIDRAVKSGEGVGLFKQGFVDAADEYEFQRMERESAIAEAEQEARAAQARRMDELNAYLSEVVPDVFTASNGVEVHTNGSYDPIVSNWTAFKDGKRLTKRDGKQERNVAFSELRALIREQIDQFDTQRSAPDTRFRETGGRRTNYSDPAYVQSEIERLKGYVESAKRRKSFRAELARFVAGRVRALVGRETVSVMGKREFDALINQVANAVAVQDVEKPLERIEEITTNLAIKKAEAKLEQLLNLKVQGENSTGVSVAKTVDDATRQVIEFVKENMGKPVSEVENRIADKESATSEEVSAVEMVGIEILKLMESAKGVEDSIAQINEQIKALIEANATARKMRKMYQQDGQQAEAEKQKKLIEENNELISAMETERVEATKNRRQYIDSVVELVESAINGGRGAYSTFIQESLRQKQELLKGAFEDIDSGRALELFDRPKNKVKRALEVAWNFLLSPAGSMLHLIRRISVNAANGRGNLYDEFIYGENGYVEAQNNFYNGVKSFQKELDEAARHIFGKSYADVLNNSGKPSGITLTIRGGANRVDNKDLSIGEALYIYMVSKMADGKVKLLKMGIDEDAIERIVHTLPEGYIDFADWVQEEFLPRRRQVYNETHLRMFGTQMAKIDHYVPLRTRAIERYQEVGGEGNVNEQGETILPTTMTGAIINRRRNNVLLDVTTNIFDLLLEHGVEMEHWNAYSPVVRGMNQLLSNTRVRLILENQKEGLHKQMKDAAQVAANQFRVNNDVWNKAMVWLSKGLTSGAISWRFFTAFKQLFSAPVFVLHSLNPSYQREFWKAVAKPKDSLSWAYDNLPSLRERWDSRSMGNEKLNAGSAYGLGDKLMLPAKLGMLPNAAVDYAVCAVGAKAVYEYRLQEYKKQGYSEEEAMRLAKIDATIVVNESQQSAENLYLAPIQKKRDLASVSLSVFRNANFGYLRKTLEGLQELFGRNKTDEVKHSKKRLMKKGYSAGEAQLLAEENVSEAKRQALNDALLFAFGLNILWNIGSNIIPYMFLAGDDDDKEISAEDVLKEIAMAPIGNLAFGSQIQGVINGYDLQFGMFPAEINELRRIIRDGDGKKFNQTAAYLAFNLAGTMSTGIAPETLVRWYEAIDGAITHGADVRDLLDVANIPRSQLLQIESVPRKDESLETYQERMADLERYLNDRIDDSQLNRWANNYYNYRLSEAIDRRFVRDHIGRVSIPAIDAYKEVADQIEEEYNAEAQKGVKAAMDFAKTERFQQWVFVKGKLNEIEIAHKVLRNPNVSDSYKAKSEQNLIRAAKELVENED